MLFGGQIHLSLMNCTLLPPRIVLTSDVPNSDSSFRGMPQDKNKIKIKNYIKFKKLKKKKKKKKKKISRKHKSIKAN